MKKIISIIIFLIIFSILFNCSKSTDPDVSFIFPLEIGNHWEYSRTYLYSNIRPDTFEISPDAWQADVILEITSLDNMILIGDNTPITIEVYHLREEYIDEDTTLYEGEAYYRNTGDGLYSYIHGYVPVPISIDTKIPEASINSRSSIINPIMFKSASTTDTVFYEDVPRKILQYPIEIGSQWCYADPNYNNAWRIDKRVIGAAAITVPAGEFACVKIQWLYDLDDDERWDNNIVYYDYLNEEGLIKRVIRFKDIVWYNEYGDTLGLVDSITEIVLTDYQLE